MNYYSHLPKVGNGSNHRDNQKSKVYAAEDVLNAWRGPHHGILLTDMKRSNGSKHPSIEACQHYVNKLTEQRWFQSRWGQRHIEVRLKVYGSATGHRGHICLPPWARVEQVILHEVAHTLVPSKYAPHGPEFAATLLVLVENHMGKHIASALRKSYAEKKVKYRNGLAAVPKAGTKTVVTKAAMVQQIKTAERTDMIVLSNKGNRKRAAESIRASVKAGLFGPSGSKPRVHALATARLLEKS